MVILFLDTSAIVKRYIAEAGSAHVNQILHESNLSYISSLTLAEVTSALARRMDAVAASNAQTQFDTDVRSSLITSGLDDALVIQAVSLVQRHRLRGCDSIQLAAASRVRQAIIDTGVNAPLHFVCADDELNHAAQIEGLLFDNPNTRAVP